MTMKENPVDAAVAHLNDQIQNRADEIHVSGYSRDVSRAIEALIVAVRAENAPVLKCWRCDGYVPSTPRCQCATPMPVERR